VNADEQVMEENKGEKRRGRRGEKRKGN